MSTLELEHAIGLSAFQGTLCCSNQDMIYPCGTSVVVSSKQDPHRQAFLAGHDDTVSCCCASAHFIASGQIGSNADVCVWEQGTNALKFRLREHEHGVSSLAISHDERLLVSVGDHFDRTIYVWDLQTGCIVANAPVPAVGGAQSATSSAAATVGPSGRHIRPPPAPPSASADGYQGRLPSAADGDVVAVAWGGFQRDIKRRPTSNYIFATVGPTATLWTLDPVRGTLQATRFQTGSHVRLFTSVSFSPDCERCFAGTQSGDFAVFLVRTLVLESLVPACSNGLRSLVATPDGGLITGGGDGSVKLFQMGTAGFVSRRMAQLSEESSVTSVALPMDTRDPTSLLASLADGHIFEISYAEFRSSLLRTSHTGAVTDVAFPPGNSERFATCSPVDGTVRVWDLSNYETISQCFVPRAHPTCVAWAGECLAVGFASGEIRFIDATNGRILWSLMDAHRGGVTAIATTQRFIISGGEGGEVRVWELRTRELVAHLKEHTQRVTGLAVFTDEQHILSSSKDRSFLCWDLKQQRRLSSHHHRVSLTSIALMPDQHRVLCTTADNALTFWDMSVPDPVQVVPNAHTQIVTCCALAHEAGLFATGSADQRIRLWTSEGRLIFEGSGHSRSIGFVTGSLPFSMDTLETDAFVTVPIGRTYQVFNVSKLRVTFIGLSFPFTSFCIHPMKGHHYDENITALTSVNELVFLSTGRQIDLWHRNTKLRTLVPPPRSDGRRDNITLLYTFGELLLAADECNMLRIWDHHSGEIMGEIPFPDDFAITGLLHPDTYLNKVLVASGDGRLEIWNLRTRRCVHQLKAPRGDGITCLVEAPTLDVVAVGHASGLITVHNVRVDVVMMAFQQKGPVSSLAFRTDGPPVLVSGTSEGELLQWDLSGRRLALRTSIHQGPVRGLAFLPRQPVLVSSGDDNSVKVWAYDPAPLGESLPAPTAADPHPSSPEAELPPRLLRSRAGHAAPPTRIRFFGDDALHLLGSAPDRALRLHHTVLDHQSCELSQRAQAALKKVARWNLPKEMALLPPIVDFDQASIRDRHWASVVSVHEGDSQVRAWLFQNKAIAPTKIKTTFTAPATAVALSPCGNFVAAGSQRGDVQMCNVQSGLLRGTFVGHTEAIVGVHFDALMKFLVTVDVTGLIKTWDLDTQAELSSLALAHTDDSSGLSTASGPLPSGLQPVPLTVLPLADGLTARRTAWAGDAGLLAVATDALQVVVIDVGARRVVRTFQGHSHTITDLCFSPDGRWVITASLDSTLRVWDLPSAHMIDWLSVPKPITSLAFALNGEFLATTHVGTLGIYLWANRMQYMRLPLTDPAPQPPPMTFPTAAGTSEARALSRDTLVATRKLEADGTVVGEATETTSHAPLAPGLITRSTMAPTAVDALTNMDLIRARNKPKEAPKAPVAAPFFLHTLPGLSPAFAPTVPTAVTPAPTSGELSLTAEAVSADQKKEAAATGNCLVLALHPAHEAHFSSAIVQAVVQYLLTLSPAGIELAIKSLAYVGQLAGAATPSYEELEWMLSLFENCMATGSDFELLQSMLLVFIKEHGEGLRSQPVLMDRARKVQATAAAQWGRLSQGFQQSLALISQYSRIQL
ncbi:putative U3 small nucleolar RNA-associated protein 21 [Paratrimastix pyriformis]|uniref:U3 small nucleolar RNA-associated protein 21 n=1 Tax=Paratrimastix pyriformis TaxID=342808 RepID=A0ABQ8U6E8_9EUKA|nr:putative U3 small nucleolar RNA-associated protein 21 [Paratrimastix pyriformis]